MNEQDVRALVREAIERHLGRPQELRGRRAIFARIVRRKRLPTPCLRPLTSHILLKVLPGSEVDDGMCVIEPAVRCNHCGFCQSYGH